MKKLLMKPIVLMLATLVSIVMISCHNNKKVDIYTSVYVLTYITSEIVQDKAIVESIYPNNADVHDYEPTPKNIVKFLSSDMIFYIGLGLEPFIEESIESTFKDMKCVKISSYESINLVTTDGEACTYSEHNNLTNHDPHLWLDPYILVEVTKIILNNLLELEKYQKHEEFFRENANTLIQNFTNLGQEYDNVLTNSNKKTIIVDHNSYSYLAYRYNLTVKSLRGDKDSSDPNSKEFISIINYAYENRIQYLLANKYNNQESLLKTYQSQLNNKDSSINCTILYLDNLERKTEQNNDFIEVLKDNLKVLKKALE